MNEAEFPSANDGLAIRPSPPPPWRCALRPLADLFFPPYCPLCCERLTDADQVISEDCRKTMAPLPHPRCAFCGATKIKDDKGKWCRACPPRPIYFATAQAATQYSGPAGDAVKALKYRGRLELAPVMARRMALFFAHEGLAQTGPIDWIVPVPLHFTRLWRRGFNQSWRIADGLARVIGVPLLERALLRIRRTRQQTLVAPEERLGNVEGAFAVAQPEAIQGKSLLLIDDVFTSGATANACSKALREAGAAAVHSFTFARP